VFSQTQRVDQGERRGIKSKTFFDH